MEGEWGWLQVLFCFFGMTSLFLASTFRRWGLSNGGGFWLVSVGLSDGDGFSLVSASDEGRFLLVAALGLSDGGGGGFLG